MARLLGLVLAGLLALAPGPAWARPDGECVMQAADAAWLRASLEQWLASQRVELQLADPSLPRVYAVDDDCLYVVVDQSLRTENASVHREGEVDLPSVGSIPVGPVSFAFAADGFVMSLPSVWRNAGVKSEFGLERLMTGVLLHEIAHTRQSDMVAKIAEPAAIAAGLGDELSDDLLQERFAGVPGYEAAVRAETATLFAAAQAADEAGARGLAAHALHQMRARREHWLSGDNAHFAVFDDVFLTMEGTGQWLIYRYFVSSAGGGHTAADAEKETRRGGKWWSQDEGLALFLVIDRLLPDWRERASRNPDWLAERLLTAAVENKG